MGNDNSGNNDQTPPDAPAKVKLRGAALKGSEQKAAVDHADYEKTREPDSELRVDGEEDTLYNDGLDTEVDPEPPFGTRGPSSGIKP
jgi:hypothetical protein